MSLMEGPVPVAAVAERQSGCRSGFFRKVLDASGALAAGWRASIDVRRLDRMSGRELDRLGLARSGVPTEIHRRHFAELGLESG